MNYFHLYIFHSTWNNITLKIRDACSPTELETKKRALWEALNRFLRQIKMYIFGKIFSAIHMYLYSINVQLLCLFSHWGKLLMSPKIKCLLVGSYLTVWAMWRGFNISFRAAPFKLAPRRLASWRSQPDISQFWKE